MFIWLTVIVRLLRGTRQASGGRHFEDFTYRSSLRNAFITFQSLIIPFLTVLNRWFGSRAEGNWKTPNVLECPLSRAKISRSDRLGFIALRPRGWPTRTAANLFSSGAKRPGISVDSAPREFGRVSSTDVPQFSSRDSRFVKSSPSRNFPRSIL